MMTRDKCTNVTKNDKNVPFIFGGWFRQISAAGARCSLCLPRGLPRDLSALRWGFAITRTRTSGDRAVCQDRQGASLEIRNWNRAKVLISVL